MLIDKEDPSQKAYELHMAKARAEEDIRDLQERFEELWEMAKAILARLADIE